ncbi:hypothetical protein JCM25156A_21620 [Komagataeibacter kakiaceti JCM 25156]
MTDLYVVKLVKSICAGMSEAKSNGSFNNFDFVFSCSEKVFKFITWLICLATVQYLYHESGNIVLLAISMILSTLIICSMTTFLVLVGSILSSIAIFHIENKILGFVYNFFIVLISTYSVLYIPHYIIDNIVPVIEKFAHSK